MIGSPDKKVAKKAIVTSDP